jgi:hypothetical protein
MSSMRTPSILQSSQSRIPDAYSISRNQHATPRHRRWCGNLTSHTEHTCLVFIDFKSTTTRNHQALHISKRLRLTTIQWSTQTRICFRIESASEHSISRTTWSAPKRHQVTRYISHTKISTAVCLQCSDMYQNNTAVYIGCILHFSNHVE